MDDVEDVEAGEDAAAGIAAQLVIKNNSDQFEEFSDEQFLRNFRFDKDRHSIKSCAQSDADN